MRRRFSIPALAACVLFALPVAADAPISGPDRQYEDFTGGDIQITDHFTLLVWDRPLVNDNEPYPPAVTFAAAQTSCPAPKRLPSMKELLTLVDEDPHPEYEGTANVPKMIDQNAFAKTPSEPFWTSSVTTDGKVWTVDFADGTTAISPKGDKRRVRCVK